MREVFGELGDPEYIAAQQLSSMIADEWGALDDPQQKVSLITAAQCYGQRVRDVDLLLLVQLKNPLSVPIPRSLELGLPAGVYVKSLCVAIEIKDHRAEDVMFTSNGEVQVRYGGHLHNASRQNRNQVFSLKGYLENAGHDTVPFIAGVVWLRGVPHDQLPQGLHNIIGADATWRHFIAAILSQQHAEYRDGFDVLNSSNEYGRITRIKNAFTQRLRPSSLDRRKVEAISRQAVMLGFENAKPGERQNIYRGRGGTGKTIALLHLAFERYVQARQRTLFLTYNIALAAEVERLLIILGVRDQIASRSIRVETIQTFMGQVLHATGLLKVDDDFLTVYENRKHLLLEYLNDPDLVKAVRAESDLLMWDLVCVDEAQDFPEDERDILHLLFGAERCVIADGIDQMVRPADPCNWHPTNAIRGLTDTHFLKKSLRMQYNVCRFANAVAGAIGLKTWHIEPNGELLGGRILITRHSGMSGDSPYERLAELNRDNGNTNVDMLFCVPHTLVDRSFERYPCLPARQFMELGRKVWDGTHSKGKMIPLLDNDLHRFVQYESCRGLEGWVTFLYALDRFYELKIQQFQNSISSNEDQSLQHLSAQFASEWLMIPLTRCINTLVIQIENADSEIGKVLLDVGRQFEDFVEIEI